MQTSVVRNEPVVSSVAQAQGYQELSTVHWAVISAHMNMQEGMKSVWWRECVFKIMGRVRIVMQ